MVRQSEENLKAKKTLEAGRGEPSSPPDPNCKTCGGDGLQRVTLMYPPSEDHYCHCCYR